MTTVYRLVRAARAQDALSGEGARLYGGRWNPPGFPVVYASQSRSLAVLETLVHLLLEARGLSYVMLRIALPKEAHALLYKGRSAAARMPSTQVSREAGQAWLEDARALALAVPSSIVPQETNYVLNVRHPQFAGLRIEKRERFSFDERLWRDSLKPR